MDPSSTPPNFRPNLGLYNDPLYGYIPIHPKIRKGMNQPTMQRLRHIKQLSTVYLVYPGATHSRFEHSMGVYFLSTKAFESLLQKKTEHGADGGWPELTIFHKMAVQLAAMFHDVGHGPWSHVFETFCRRNEEAYDEWNHETLTYKLVSKGVGRYKDIPQYLEGLRETLRTELNISRAQTEILSPENIARIATGQYPKGKNSKYLFLSNIISGCFDVDRMDYLKRDARYTGIDTGNIDIWEIIHRFTIVPEKTNPKVWGIKLDKDAALSVECLLTARDLYYRQVCYNKTHRSAQEMLIRGLEELVAKSDFSIKELSLLTDYELLELFKSKDWGTAFTRELARKIWFRRLYEPLPLRINIATDLDSIARQKLYAYRTTEIHEWREQEENFRKLLKIPKDNRPILDIELIPVSKKDDYEGNYFYDFNDHKRISLIDISPHLRLLHGKYLDNLSGKEIDLWKQYQQQVSQVFVFLPFEKFCEWAEMVSVEAERRPVIEKHTFQDIEKATKKIMKPVYKDLKDFLFGQFLQIGDKGLKARIEKRLQQNFFSYIAKLTYHQM